MQLNTLYNWPPGENEARVDLGMVNVEDLKKEFRVGVTTVEDPKLIAWHDLSWIAGSEIENRITFQVHRGQTVYVQHRPLGATEPDGQTIMDTEKEWPAEAQGEVSVNTGLNF